MSPAEAQLALLEALTHAAGQERTWAVATAGFGAAAVLLSIACWLVWARPVTRGAAVPLAILGAIFAVTGAVDFANLSREQQALPEQLQEAPHLLTSQVLPRALEALQSHRMLRFADGALVLVGLALMTRRERLFGAGLGLALMSGASLGLDSLAVERHAARVELLERVEALLRER